MSRDVQYLSTQVIPIPTGITNATYFGQDPEQMTMGFKWLSGGSLLMFGTTRGMTMSGNSLLGAYSGLLYYPVSINEVMNIDGPAAFYLSALGSTCNVGFFKGKS